MEAEANSYSFAEVLELLRSPLKLERDRGANELQKLLVHADVRTAQELGDALIALLEDNSKNWETKHGALLGLSCLIPYLKQEDGGDDFHQKFKHLALNNLTDAEVRVRQASGELLGALCKFCGPSIYEECKDQVLDLIRNNLERQITEDNAASQIEQIEKKKLLEKFASSLERGVDAEQIFHDTAGWKSLETSMKALQAMVDGCGSSFLPWINQDLLDLIFQTLTHTNRFVRETGFYVCSSLVGCGNSNLSDNNEEDLEGILESNAIYAYGHQFSKYLGIGLSDNWSQVRLAACTATRKFLLSLPCQARHAFFPELLPKLCLNRYYLAEGVRIYSQETWRLIAGNEGRQLVHRYISEVIAYYMSQTQADNHAVREAACSCVAELASKITSEAIQPYVHQLLDTLIECFQDDSWPVRDAACLASGNFILNFPEECRNSLDALYPLFFMNLEDNIPSVRQGAAASIVNLVKAYGKEALDIILEKVKQGLKVVETQLSDSEKYGALEKGPAQFGVVKRLRDNDMELHTNQTMYSCGSLAPKMHRRAGGCMDRTFRRPPQPWEISDGCVYLVAELSSIQQILPHATDLIELIIFAGSKRHYTHHVVLLETICKEIPVIAKGLGKRNFKPYLEAFWEPIFYSLNSENALTSAAASECLRQLANFFGPNVIRGRIEQYDSRLLQQFDSNLHGAPF